ncbi:K(+)-transporting ATPase subunit F [Neobacillus drentensis]
MLVFLGILTAAMFIYLGYVLIHPEKF